ncbi:MAG TPA: efflux RND transporter periplasmic adaptor subunit [Candidatus Acidoferrum sp.]|jgi:membrane fusion protein (multidrug efflux system)|nr:efflux RND transporter periplasmic adaptor subunit [Candidatus Acidoferrum sp.]
MNPFAHSARVALLMLSAGSLAACNAASAAAPAPSPSPAPAVDTFVARVGSVRPTLAVSGVLAPYRDIGVSAALNEPIVEIPVHEGQRVHAGDVLAVLESDNLRNSLAAAQATAAENRARFAQQGYQSSVNVAQYASNVSIARAALAQSQATLNQAEIDLHRYELLQRQGYLPDQTLEGQRVTVAADRQAVTAAKAQLVLAVKNASAGGDARRAGIESAQIDAMRAAAAGADQAVAQIRLQLERTVLRAPSDGVIASIAGAIGEYPSGRQLFTIHDDTQMYAMLAASGTQAVALRGGEPATVATTNGALRASGVVEAVLDQLSPGTTNFIVKVRLRNGDHRLRAGIPVTARIALAPVTGTRVPVSAYADVTNDAVYTVEHGKVARRAVRTLASDGSAAIVEGLEQGARIVRDGQSGVAAGDTVAN